jgi:hypothetical protein
VLGYALARVVCTGAGGWRGMLTCHQPTPFPVLSGITAEVTIRPLPAGREARVAYQFAFYDQGRDVPAARVVPPPFSYPHA